MENNQNEKQPTSIKDFRLIADMMINSTQYLIQGREVSLVHTNLQRCKMWLGKALGELGNPTPYANSENPANSIIDKQAEHTESSLGLKFQKLEQTHTARVKYFRTVCQNYIDDFNMFINTSESAGKKYDLYLQQSLLAMEESKMWLGWELDRIRVHLENIDSPSTPSAILPL